MIYVDTSVVLAQLLAEDRRPAAAFWDQAVLISSRLLEYEVWTHINARGLALSVARTCASSSPAPPSWSWSRPFWPA